MNVHPNTCTQLTWLLDCDINVEEDFNAVREESSPPVDDKHDDTAEQCTQQGQPHVVVFIRWSPTWETTSQRKDHIYDCTLLDKWWETNCNGQLRMFPHVEKSQSHMTVCNLHVGIWINRERKKTNQFTCDISLLPTCENEWKSENEKCNENENL